MTQAKKDIPLDQEEKDLEQALSELDVSQLPKPNSETQKQFKTAAENFRRDHHCSNSTEQVSA